MNQINEQAFGYKDFLSTELLFKTEMVKKKRC